MSSGFIDEPILREEEGLFARDIDGQLLRMDQATLADLEKDVTIKIDGQEITVKKAVPLTDSQGNILRDADGQPTPRATTIYDAASRLCAQTGVANPIPTLCHREHLNPVAVCRVCVVEIRKIRDGKPRTERKLLPACQHRVEETMEIHTMASPEEKTANRIRNSVKVLAELLTADHLPPADEKSRQPYNELAQLARRLEVTRSRFAPAVRDRGKDDSSLVIAVDHNACILCDRCSRGCDDVKKNFIIGRSGKGYTAHIGFDLDEPMGQSHCVSCGECMISCPTGALTFLRPVGEQKPGEPRTDGVPTETLMQYPIFAGVPYKFLQWNARSLKRRLVKEGDVLCKEGDQGNTAFLLIRGRYEVSIQSALRELRNEPSTGLKAFFGRIRTTLTAQSPEDRDDPRKTTIRNDGGVPLPLSKPMAVRTPADVILGEMTCMSHYPRSATVTALEDGEVLEIGRNVLYMLQRNRSSREILDKAYRANALQTHLENSPFLAGLDESQRRACVALLSDKVELIRVEPGQVIFREGDRADHFYLVRLGFVRVSQKIGNQERVLDYLGPGKDFGEIGLLSSIVDMSEGALPAGTPRGLRTATCRALDDVELVCIRGEHFRELLHKVQGLREPLLKRANDLLSTDKGAGPRLDPLDEFLEQGLFNAQKLLVLDLERCTRCDECTKACSDTHGGVTRLIREGLRFDKFLVASSCRSCLDPYCLVGCPVNAIRREPRKNGDFSLEIVIDRTCIGCGLCASNCPYGNINMHGTEVLRPDPLDPKRFTAATQQKATTCDLCRDVVGPNEDPSCVYACPHNAAFRMSGDELRNRVAAKNR